MSALGGASVTKVSWPITPAAGDVRTDYRFTNDSSRLVYRVDAEVDEEVELYSVRTNGGSDTKISGPLAPGGRVTEFQVTPGGGRVVYMARRTARTPSCSRCRRPAAR